MHTAPARRGHPRASALRYLRTFLLAVCAALAVVLHHDLPAAEAMPSPYGDASMASAEAAGSAAATVSVPTAVRLPDGPAASSAPAMTSGTAMTSGSGPGDAGCPQAHCTAPDVRLYQLLPPALLPAGPRTAASAAVSSCPVPSWRAVNPSPPTPTTLCVLRT